MIAELAIANAAFAVIKKTLQNGKELMDAGDAVNKYFTAEKAIAKKAASTSGNVLEAFQAKELLARQEEELKFMLNKQRLQGYQDFLKFKAEYTRDLRESELKERKNRAKRQEVMLKNLNIAIVIGLVFVLIIGFLFGAAVYIKQNPSTLSSMTGHPSNFQKMVK